MAFSRRFYKFCTLYIPLWLWHSFWGLFLSSLAATFSACAFFDRIHWLANGISHLLDTIAYRTRSLKLQCVGSRQHFGFELSNILFGDVLCFVRAPNRRIGLGVRRCFGFDTTMNRFCESFLV